MHGTRKSQFGDNSVRSEELDARRRLSQPILKRCVKQGHGLQVMRSLAWTAVENNALFLAKASCANFANVRGLEGITAMHIAAFKGWIRLIRLLVRMGADPCATTNLGDTPLHFALMAGQLHAAVVLTKMGCKWNDRNKSGETCLSLFNCEWPKMCRVISTMSSPRLLPSVLLTCSKEAFQCIVSRETNLKLRNEDDSAKELHNICWCRIGGMCRKCCLFNEPLNVARAKFDTIFNEVEDLIDEEFDESLRYSVLSQLEDEVLGLCNPSLLHQIQEQMGRSMDSPAVLSIHFKSDLFLDNVLVFKRLMCEKLKFSTQLYVFGKNDSCNLGLGSSKEYEKPVLLEPVSKDDATFATVSMSKHHTLLLTHAGTVKAWGHGVGGRLGTGREDTAVRPEHVVLPGNLAPILEVAAAVDHSLFLTECAEVLSCGRNTHYQLGVPGLTCHQTCLSPQLALNSFCSLCTGEKLGIVCSRYHSVAWCRHYLFMWGTNIGQMGQTKEKCHVLSKPTRIEVNIKQRSPTVLVSVCEVASAVLLYNGSLIVLTRYSTQVITTTLSGPRHKLGDSRPIVQRIVVYGDASNSGKTGDPGGGTEHLQNKEATQPWRSDVTVIVLTTGGRIAIWKQSRVSFCKVHIDTERILNPIDIALTENGQALLIVTSTGELVKCLISEDLKQKNVINIKELFPMSGIQHCCRLFSDPLCRNFAVVTLDWFSIVDMPVMTLSDAKVEPKFRKLLDLPEDEDFHDVLLECEQGSKIPAHKAILCTRSEYFRKVFLGDNSAGINDYIGTDSPKKCAEKTITTCCGLKWFNQTPNRSSVISHVRLNAPIFSDCLKEIKSCIYTGRSLLQQDNYSDESSTFLKEGKLSGSFGNDRETKKFIARMKKAASILQIDGCNLFENLAPRFTKTMQEVVRLDPDIEFVSLEGVVGPRCHKCVLVARVPYFETFFSCRWHTTPSNIVCQQVTSPYSGSVALTLMLQYCYISKICFCNVTFSEAVELLALADEWLCTEAQRLAEQFLVTYISSRSFMALLLIACQHNATHLYEALMYYAANNVPLLIANRLLDNFPEKELANITKIIQEIFSDGCCSTYESCTENFHFNISNIEFAIVQKKKPYKQNWNSQVTKLCPNYLKGSEEELFSLLARVCPELLENALSFHELIEAELNNEALEVSPIKEKQRCPKYEAKNVLTLEGEPELMDQNSMNWGLEFSDDESVQELDGDEGHNDWQVVNRKSGNTGDLWPFDSTDSIATLFAPRPRGKSGSKSFSDSESSTAAESTSLPSKKLSYGDDKFAVKAQSFRQKNKSSSESLNSQDLNSSSELKAFSQGDIQENTTTSASSSIEDVRASELETYEEYPSLAQSIAQAKQADKQPNKKVFPFPAFPKISQKERAKQRNDSSKAAKDSLVPQNRPSAWRSSGKDVQQSHKQSEDFPQLSSTCRNNHTAWRNNVDDAASGAQLAEPNPSQISSGFSRIMEDERLREENLARSQKKSFDQIQKEEAAIAELTRYYRNMAGPRDRIEVVRTLQLPLVQPCWTEKHRPRYST